MDIIKFLNSRDIAEHLRKIDYKFSPEEALYVIHASRNRTLDEKREAYKALVAAHPDYKLKERNYDAFKGHTLESFISAYLTKLDGLIEECKKPDKCALYYADTYNSDDGWNRDSRVFYDTFDECFSASADEYTQKLCVTKKFVNTNDWISVTLSADGAVLDAESSESDLAILEAFEMMYVEIPTPFGFGDIVKPISETIWGARFHDPYEGVCVLTSLPHWDGEEIKGDPREVKHLAAHKRLRAHHLEEGDETDMIYAGYFLDEDNSVCRTHSAATYLDLEFCNDKLVGRGRILKAISLYFKNELDLMTLLAVIKTVEAEQTADQIKDRFLCGYERWTDWFDEIFGKNSDAEKSQN